MFVVAVRQRRICVCSQQYGWQCEVTLGHPRSPCAQRVGVGMCRTPVPRTLMKPMSVIVGLCVRWPQYHFTPCSKHEHVRPTKKIGKPTLAQRSIQGSGTLCQGALCRVGLVSVPKRKEPGPSIFESDYLEAFFLVHSVEIL